MPVATDEDRALVEDGRGDRDSVRHLVGILPQQPTVIQPVSDNVLGSPAEKQPLTRMLDNDWRAVTGWIVAAEPQLRARAAIIGRVAAAGQAGVNDGLLAIDDDGGSEPPFGNLRAVVFHEVFRPDGLAGSGIEAVQVAYCAQRIDPGVVDGGRAARPLAIVEFAVGCRIVMLPQEP